jgi:hypothetical protein
MFPLAGKEFPTTTDELTTAIQDALAEVFTIPKKAGVSAEGTYASIKRLTVDLSGATVSATKPPPKPTPTGKRQPGPSVQKLEVRGEPVEYQKSKVNFEVTAKGVKLDYARDKGGKPLLVLADAESGSADARITKADIESLARAVASEAAKQQGVNIQELHVDLASHGPRSVSVEAKVKAKKLMMSGTLHVSGRLDIDDELNATVSGLACKGEGVVGSMAAGVVQSKLKQYEGTRVSLMAFSLGDVKLRDLKIDTKSGLHVTAAFGREG